MADCSRFAKHETAGSKASCEIVKDVIYLVTNGGRCYLLQMDNNPRTQSKRLLDGMQQQSSILLAAIRTFSDARVFGNNVHLHPWFGVPIQ